MMSSTDTTAKYHRTDFDGESVEASGMAHHSDAGNQYSTNPATSIFDTPAPAFPQTRSAPRIYLRSQLGCWKSRTLGERLVAASLVILILTVIILAIILGNLRLRVIERPVVIRQNITYIMGNNGSVCLTRTCVEASARLMDNMDFTADPCQDFHQYACGGFIKGTSIPAGMPQWSLFMQRETANHIIIRNMIEQEIKPSDPRSHKLAKMFYRSCLNQSRLEELGAQPLLDLISSIGGWDIINTWNRDKWDFTEAVALIMKNARSYPFFQFLVNIDHKNSSVNILQLDQDGLRLESREYYLNKTVDNDERLRAYLNLMTEIGVLLGGERNKTRSKMLKVIEFETKLAEVIRPMEEKRNQMENYNKMSFLNLTELCPTIDWVKAFNIQFELVNIKLNLSEELVVYYPLYIKQMCQLVQKELATKDGKELMHNHMVWGVVYSYISLLSEKFANVYDKFLKVYKGLQGRDDRWRICVKMTESVFDNVVAAMFVSREFNESAKDNSRTMIRRITAAFKGNLYNVKWMDDETRKLALKKVESMSNMVGYPDYILNKTALNLEYKDFQVKEADLFSTLLGINLLQYGKSLARLRKKPDKMRWEMKPTEINAYYTQNKNQIVFAAGILQRPFYDPNYPEAMNFGGIGVVVGHEMTHGFDDKGREYDPEGNLRIWWNSRTIKNFVTQSQCMVDQYSSYKIYGLHIKGQFTLGENIADNGGLKASYLAYQKYVKEHGREQTLPAIGLSLEQLFFLSYAQVWCSIATKEFAELELNTNSHSPEKYRVIGPLSNSPDFAAAYKCPLGSPMNPKSKCQVW